MLGSGNRHKLSPFSRNMSRWEFKDFPTSKIELLKNNQLKIEHENIEIDSNIVSFGGAKKRPIKELLQQETISFVLIYFEEGKPGRVDEKYWFLTVTKTGEKDKQKFNAKKAKKDQEVNQKLESGKSHKNILRVKIPRHHPNKFD